MLRNSTKSHLDNPERAGRGAEGGGEGRQGRWGGARGTAQDGGRVAGKAGGRRGNHTIHQHLHKTRARIEAGGLACRGEESEDHAPNQSINQSMFTSGKEQEGRR